RGRGRALDRNTVGEDVTQRGGSHLRRADVGVQRQRLAAGESRGLDVDVLEAGVVVAGPGQVLHIAGGQEQRQVEGVADQVAGVESAAAFQGKLIQSEGAVAGLELAAAGDVDVGRVVTGADSGEGSVGAVDVKDPAVSNGDLRRRSIAITKAHRIVVAEGQVPVIGDGHARLDKHADVGRHRE